MSLTKSLVLTVHWAPNIYLKRLKTFTLTDKCSIFDVSYKKHLVTTRKLWNHQNTCNLQCFGRKPSFVDPPLGTSLGPHWSLNTAQKRRRSDFDKVSHANCLKSWFLKDVINKITVFGSPRTSGNRLRNPPEQDLGFRNVDNLVYCLEHQKKTKKSHATARDLTGRRPRGVPIRESENH